MATDGTNKRRRVEVDSADEEDVKPEQKHAIAKANLETEVKAKEKRRRYLRELAAAALRICIEPACTFQNDYDAESIFLDSDSSHDQVDQAKEDIRESYRAHYAHCLNMALLAKAWTFFALRGLYRDLAFFDEATWLLYRKLARSPKNLAILSGTLIGGVEGYKPLGHLARSILPHIGNGRRSMRLLEENASLWPNMRTLYLDNITSGVMSVNFDDILALEHVLDTSTPDRAPVGQPGEPLELCYPRIESVHRYVSDIDPGDGMESMIGPSFRRWHNLKYWSGSGSLLPYQALRSLHLYAINGSSTAEPAAMLFSQLEELTVHYYGVWSTVLTGAYPRLSTMQKLVDGLGPSLRHLEIRTNILDGSKQEALPGQLPGQQISRSVFKAIEGDSLLKRFPRIETLNVSRYLLNDTFWTDLALLPDNVALCHLIVADQARGVDIPGRNIAKIFSNGAMAGHRVYDFVQKTTLDIRELSQIKRAADLILAEQVPWRHSVDALLNAQMAAANAPGER